jgi:hypothetical protein
MPMMASVAVRDFTRGILQPTVRFDDLERIGRRHQDLCEQSVRIERYRGEKLIESGLFSTVAHQRPRRGIPQIPC